MSNTDAGLSFIPDQRAPMHCVIQVGTQTEVCATS
jgi:hypothetical protein